MSLSFRLLTAFVNILIMLSSIAGAQPKGGDERAEEQLKRMKVVVGLSADQVSKVRNIMKKSREEARRDFEKNAENRVSGRELMMKIVEKTDAEIMKLLTKQQQLRYEEYKKERQKDMQDRMRERQ